MMDLIKDIRGDRYKPQASCPQCGNRMEAIDIISGFRRDPLDFDTTCNKCKHRFQPRLVCMPQDGVRIELPFICATQVLGQLEGKDGLTPEEIARQFPSEYRSAIIHWGTLRSAFGKIGIKYPHKEVVDWKKKVLPYLGQLSDGQIARAVGVSSSTIRRLRIKNDIAPFSYRKIAEQERLI